MDAKTLDQIKQKLLNRQTELEAELAKISSSDEHGSEASYEDIEDDEDVNAQEVTQFADRQSLVAQFAEELDDVKKSLKNIDKGEYGKCKYCQKEIDPQRLLARPSSGSCVECKAALQGEAR